MNPTLLYATAAATLILSTARLTRLLVHDKWPPAVTVRVWWMNATNHGPWADLVTCPFCVTPYLTAGILTWGLAVGVPDGDAAAWSAAWWWWLFNGWLALSYLAAMVVVRDEPAE